VCSDCAAWTVPLRNFCDYELEAAQSVHNLLMREAASAAVRRTGKIGDTNQNLEAAGKELFV
jgi:hypothetical protein